MNDLAFLRLALEDSAADAWYVEEFVTSLSQRVADQLCDALACPPDLALVGARDIVEHTLGEIAEPPPPDGVALPQYVMARLVRRKAADLEKIITFSVARHCAEIIAARRC